MLLCPPPGGGEPKIHMVDFVNGSSTCAKFFSLNNLQQFCRYASTLFKIFSKRLQIFKQNKLRIYWTPNYIIEHLNFWPRSPRGGHKKFGFKCAFLLELTVRVWSEFMDDSRSCTLNKVNFIILLIRTFCSEIMEM